MSNNKPNQQQNQPKRGELPNSVIMDEAPFIAKPDANPITEALAEAGLSTEQKTLSEVIPAQLAGVLDAVNTVKAEESVQPAAPVKENPISSVTKADLKVAEEPAKVNPRQVRINSFVAPFRKYAERMAAGTAHDQASIIRNQRDLFKAFRNLLAVDDGQVFGPAFKEVLAIWHDNKDGAFDANIRLYRQIDNLQLSQQENLEFNTLLRLMDAIHDSAKRQANLLQIDLNRALPEIGGIDARGYLAGFVRRF